MMTPASILRTLKQAIRSHGVAWPGGYPMFTVTDDGETMSIDACKAEFKQIVRSTLTHARDGWEIVGVDINWEDMDMVCAHTGEPIECAYPADEPETIMACEDCLMYAANGDVLEGRDIEADIQANLGFASGRLACGDGEQDDEFSWSACECCGSRLGGSRHQLVIMPA